MLRSVITHVSLSAMLLHLAWGHCALHLASCESHGHEHAHQPAEAPAHDDCHESHASAVVSQATVAPPPPLDSGTHFLLAEAAESNRSASCQAAPTTWCDADPLRPLPLRAHLRLGVLLN